MAMHYSEGGTLEEADGGFIEPACICGKKLGVYLDSESAADALMDHAYEQGRLDERKGD